MKLNNIFLGITVAAFTLVGAGVAQAATTSIDGDSTTLDESTSEYSATTDTFGLENIELTFDYDGTSLDKNDDDTTLNYSAGSVNDSVTITGQTDEVESESGSVTLADIPAEDNLQITIDADTSGFATSSDSIELTNITVSGDEVETDTVTNTRTENTYSTTQAAIDDESTESGDTIKVASGTYDGATINKNVAIVGEGNPEIQTQMELTADGASLQGVTFSDTYDDAVLTLSGNGNSVDNIVMDVGIEHGASIDIKGDNATIENSEFTRSGDEGFAFIEAFEGPNSVEATGAPTGTLIQNNTLTGGDIGVQVEAEGSVTIQGNSITPAPSDDDAIWVTGVGYDPAPESATITVENNGALAALEPRENGDYAYYTTIQAAVDAASSSDTVEVAPGTYNESVTIDTSDITLESTDGRDQTTISPQTGQNNKGVNIKASDVTVRGFSVTSDLSNPTEFYGIRLDPSSGAINNVLIEDNIVKDISATSRAAGISLDMKNTNGKTATNVTVRDNKVQNISAIEHSGDAFVKGIETNHRFEGLLIEDNTIRNIGNKDSAGAVGITLQDGEVNVGAENFTITENDINGITTDGEEYESRGEEFEPQDLYIHTYPELGDNHVVTKNKFRDGGVYRNTEDVDSPDQLVVANNWWGAASGPSDAGPGSGTQVGENVDFGPWYVNAGLSISNLSDDKDTSITTFDVNASGTAATTTSSGSSVNLDFSNATSSPNEVTVVESSGPTSDADAETGDDNTVYLDISTDSGNASGTITVTLDANRFENPQEAELRHYNNSSWNTLDTDASVSGGTLTLTAQTSSFSPFAAVDGPEVSSGGGGGSAPSRSGGGGDDDSDDGEVAGVQDDTSDESEDEVVPENDYLQEYDLNNLSDEEFSSLLDDVLEQTLAIAAQLDMDVEALRANL